MHSFEAFAKYLEDELGPIPSKDHILGRIDINGDYEPDNLYWVTRKEQNLNRRRQATYANKPVVSEYTGVFHMGAKYPNHPWRARIVRDNKQIHIGGYGTEEAAHEAIVDYLKNEVK